ncbi:response regulator transcription factor [Methylomicrobium sp. Wu6]|uniref:response regulator transcription factor n=1 Tax=Methylomicrobium sp. Wu6 TaxID=3107928 RepID=UPI002DD643DF|nr:response regulator transcription factor [Methylomicrobium sp. Wu6]MEC4747048.1 response regulator transcription factor [Methylomicrobium sp. Wu6]
MSESVPTVFMIDDDSAVLEALSRLLRSFDLNVAAFASPQEFLEQFEPAPHGCLVLDVSMPDLNGLELQQELAARGNELPVIFLTGHGDIPMSVRAMKQGAVDFLTKPVQGQDLIEAIHAAIEKDRLGGQTRAELAEIRERLATLTPRELEVLEHVVYGRRNKQIAADLGTCEKTIKVHRAHLMTKLKARSLADVVRLAERVGIRPVAPVRNDYQP